MKFFIRNAGWSILHPAKALEVQKAMNTHRTLYPCCAITGSTKKVQVHHIVPVWANPDLAADPSNFISLSASAHIHHIYGHARSFSGRYVENIKEISKKMLALQQECIIISRRPQVTAKQENSKFSLWKRFIAHLRGEKI